MEPYGGWEGMDWDSKEYREKKREVEELLWSSIKVYIMNVRYRLMKGTLKVVTFLNHK